MCQTLIACMKMYLNFCFRCQHIKLSLETPMLFWLGNHVGHLPLSTMRQFQFLSLIPSCVVGNMLISLPRQLILCSSSLRTKQISYSFSPSPHPFISATNTWRHFLSRSPMDCFHSLPLLPGDVTDPHVFLSPVDRHFHHPITIVYLHFFLLVSGI